MAKYLAVFYFTILFAICLNLCYSSHMKPKYDRRTRQAEVGYCRLPAHPENGKWIAFGHLTTELQPGSLVKELTILSYICNNGFKKIPDDFFANLICENSKWTGQTPKCLKTCQTLNSTKTMPIKCELNGTRVSCEDPYQDTRAAYKCLSGRQSNTLYSYCYNGTWYESVPTC